VYDSSHVYLTVQPENMLCTLDRRVKLVDFGNARSFGDTDSFVGTPAFMPPELCYGTNRLECNRDFTSDSSFLPILHRQNFGGDALARYLGSGCLSLLLYVWPSALYRSHVDRCL
jgi:serine/threonine protein kinase